MCLKKSDKQVAQQKPSEVIKGICLIYSAGIKTVHSKESYLYFIILVLPVYTPHITLPFLKPDSHYMYMYMYSVGTCI